MVDVVEGEKTILEGLADEKVWAGWFSEAQLWANENLFTFDTLIELGLIALAASLAWPVSAALRNRLKPHGGKYDKFALIKRLRARLHELSFPMVWLAIQWVMVALMAYLEYRHVALVVTSSLLTAWIVINIATVIVANPLLSLVISIVAWITAALNILGLLDNTIAFLDGAAYSFGKVNISLLTIVQGLFALGVLLWVTTVVGQLVEGRIKSSENLSPSIKALSTKMLRILLVVAAVLIALKIAGINLTAFAVVGGAIGVGLGFGLQKIFANLVSGFILLLDKSIKPGDVIAIADHYGRVDSLGARYVSVLTRDGIEHLIPNEELITTRVENWSHSHNLIRIHKAVGVHYKSDVKKAIALCVEAAAVTPRVLKDPAPVCHLKEFADSSVNLEIRFWIDDPMNGRASVVSELLLGIWDRFHEHGIEIPYPQSDIHIRSSALKSTKDETDGGLG